MLKKQRRTDNIEKVYISTKKLLIDEEEAKTVRLIFEKYMALESIQATVSEIIQLVVGEIVVFPERISFVLKVDGLKDLASEMAVGGYFNQPHGNPAEIPESRQDILDDGSIRITMKLELKRVEGYRRVVIPAPGAERLKETSLLRAINNARKWMDMLINGEAQNVRSVKATRKEKRLYRPHSFPEQSCPRYRRCDPRRDRTRWAVHRKADRTADPGGLERTPAALRLPGTVIPLPPETFSGQRHKIKKKRQYCQKFSIQCLTVCHREAILNGEKSVAMAKILHLEAT